MKLRMKITVAVVTHITLMLLIVTALSWMLLSKTSEAKTLDILKANVSDFSGQVNSWLSVEAQKVADLAYTFKDGEYLTNNRDGMYDALVRGIEGAPEFYALYVGCEDNFARFSDGWIPDADYIITERQWYIDAKASTEVIITDPYIDVVTNRMVTTVAKAIYDNNGKLQGVIAADIFIDELQEISKSFNSIQGVSPVLVSQEGTVIIHNNSEFLPSVDSDGNNEVYTDYNNTIKNKGITNTIDGFSHFTCTGIDDNINRYVVATTIPISNWTMYYGLDTSVMYADSIKLGTIYGILIPSILLISLFGIIFVLNICFKPLRNVEHEANKLIDGDLSVSFNYNIHDEIGTVCRIIEDTNYTIKAYVNDITEQLHKMQDGNFSETNDMKYKGDFEPIKTAFESIIDTLNDAFIEISNVADIVSADADSFSQGASNLAESSTKQATLIEEINADVSKANDKIRGTLELTNKAKSVADDTKTNVVYSNEQMNKLLQAMQEIEKSSAEICSMNKVIEDIAFQTNILALNASVEAARAGASGKGFAVVADEVRNLAGKSAEAANKTNKLIERSSEAVAKGLEYTNLTARSLETVQKQTNDVDNIIKEIAESSEEQSNSMLGISDKTEKVSEQVMTLAASAEESASASVELNTQANKLKVLINKFKLKERF